PFADLDGGDPAVGRRGHCRGLWRRDGGLDLEPRRVGGDCLLLAAAAAEQKRREDPEREATSDHISPCEAKFLQAQMQNLDRRATPIDMTAYLGVTLVAMLAALAAVGVAALLDVRNKAVPVVPRVELYDAGGHLLIAGGGAGKEEIVCRPTPSGGTL